MLRADETRRLVPLHRLLSAVLKKATEQKLSCNGTVPEAITDRQMTATIDEHGLACETLADPTPITTAHRSHLCMYNGFPEAASCSGRLG